MKFPRMSMPEHLSKKSLKDLLLADVDDLLYSSCIDEIISEIIKQLEEAGYNPLYHNLVISKDGKSIIIELKYEYR